MPRLEHQHPITGRQYVYDSGFPGAGSAGWKDKHLALSRLEHSFHTFQTVMTKLGKFLATMIDRGAINRAEHPIGHIGRARDLEKMSARDAGEGFAVHDSQFTVRGYRLGVVVWRFVAVCGWLGWDLWSQGD